MAKTALKISEDKLQADAFQWFYNSFPNLRRLLYHVPNGEKRDPITANLLKAKGVVPGIPDLVFHYRRRTYFIELKKPDGTGRLSEAQKKVHKILDLHGFIVWTIDSLDSFKGLILTIINDQDPQFTAGLTKEDFNYRNKVFNYLYSMADGQLVKISKVCEEENRSKFVKFITDFIVEGYANLEGFEILFTPDYKAFYKKLEGSDVNVHYKP